MSLDDQTPTQYHGPDAEVWIRPDGSTVQLEPARIEHLRGRLRESGWAHDPDARPTVVGPDTGHLQNCALGRTARCTCLYLTQWDRRPEYTAPTWPVISLDTVHDRELPEGGYEKRESGPNPGNEAAFEMWRNRALNAERRLFHLTAASIVMLATGATFAWAAVSGVI